MKGNYITMDGASFLTGHVLSFQSEKDFVKAYETEAYMHKEPKDRKEMLRQVYRIAKKAEVK